MSGEHDQNDQQADDARLQMSLFDAPPVEEPPQDSSAPVSPSKATEVDLRQVGEMTRVRIDAATASAAEQEEASRPTQEDVPSPASSPEPPSF